VAGCDTKQVLMRCLLRAGRRDRTAGNAGELPEQADRVGLARDHRSSAVLAKAATRARASLQAERPAERRPRESQEAENDLDPKTTQDRRWVCIVCRAVSREIFAIADGFLLCCSTQAI